VPPVTITRRSRHMGFLGRGVYPGADSDPNTILTNG
jgi:hypothetical protein